jgi:drug/metabolite transporter (DMT)-like permease
MPARAVLALAFTILIWGVAPVYIRSFSLAAGPADAMVIRYVLVSALCLLFLPFFGGFRIPRQDWPRLLVISLIGMLGYNLGSIFGYVHITAGIGGLIISTQPLLIALLAALFGTERLSMAAVAGIVVSLAGTIVLFSGHNGGDITRGELILGGGMVFLSGLAWSLYVVLSKSLIQRHGSFKITALSILIATVPMLAFASRTTIPMALSLDAAGLFALFYMVVPSTFLTVLTWNYAVGHMRPSTVGASLYLVPLIAVGSGVLLLHEEITTMTLVAGTIIMAGVAIAQFGSRLRPSGGIAALAAVVFAVTMWGLIPVAMRFLILGLSPETAMVLRLYPAGLIAVSVLTFIGVRKISWRDWGRIAIAALAGNVGYQILAAYGMKGVPASWTGLLFGLEPVFIALFAVLLAGEKLTSWLVAGMGLALAGTAALMLGSSFVPAADVSVIGLLLITVSTMGWGIYTVVIRPVSAKYGSFEVACLALGISALPMVFFVPLDFATVVSGMNGTQWLAVGFVVVFGTFLATSAWNYALGHMESSVAGIFLYVQPIVAALGGILLLHERLTWPLVAGGALIVAGVAVAQFGPLIKAYIKRTDYAADAA